MIVLFAAIRMHGSPEGLVSDGGSIFKAKQAQEVYKRLGILKHQIEKAQPWQNYIETMFNVQRRMADYEFERATTWNELQGMRETLANLAIRDPLTGLFNRRYLEESLEREVRRTAWNGMPTGVIMLDVDNVKRFNDIFGHGADDTILNSMAPAI